MNYHDTTITEDKTPPKKNTHPHILVTVFDALRVISASTYYKTDLRRGRISN